MSAAERLRDLDPGDRVRVLGWLDATGAPLDVVARVVDVDHRPADDPDTDAPADHDGSADPGDRGFTREPAAEPATVGSIGVTLVPLEGPTAGFDDVLPPSAAPPDRLALFALESARGDWGQPEVWARKRGTAEFETVGTVQHVARV